MKINKSLFIVSVFLICCLIRSSHGGKKSPCPQSMDTASIHITRCPKDRKEMEYKSKIFKCEDRRQNCTTAEKYKYHCVLNSKGDGLIELCAPEVEIIGRRCTEFTTGGKFLQEHLERRCATCPFKYKSSESYKYDECYQLKFLRTLSSVMKEKTTESSREKNMFEVTQKDDRSLNDAVKDTTPKFPADGSDDKTEMTEMNIIDIITTCIFVSILLVIFVVVGHKYSLRKKICTTMLKCTEDNTSHASNPEIERLSKV